MDHAKPLPQDREIIIVDGEIAHLALANVLRPKQNELARGGVDASSAVAVASGWNLIGGGMFGSKR